MVSFVFCLSFLFDHSLLKLNFCDGDSNSLQLSLNSEDAKNSKHSSSEAESREVAAHSRLDHYNQV